MLRKKAILQALAVIMTIGMVLSGCTSSPAATQSAGTEAPAVTQAATQAASAEPTAAPTDSTALKPVKLRWYNVGNPQPDQVLINEALNKYLKDKINATVTMTWIDWGGYATNLNVMMAAGDEFDICFWPGWMGAGYVNAVSKGFFTDITDLWGKYAPKTKAQLDPSFIAGSMVNGKSYGIPCNKELAHTRGIIWRKDIADKYGWDISKIKTLADLEPMLATVKEKEPDLIPFNCSRADNFIYAVDWDKLGDDAPGVVRYGDTKVINELEQPEQMAVYKLARDWYLKGYVNQDAATLGDRRPNMQAKKMFAQICPMIPSTAASESSTYGYEFQQAALLPSYIQGGDTTGSLQCISVTSPNPERALMFLELVNTDPYVNNLINYGIEGTHYVKVSDNIIDLPAGLTADKSGYRPEAQWIIGNRYINFLWKGQDPEMWKKYAEFNASATPSKLLTFTLNSDPIKNEETAIHNINEEYAPGLNTGSVDPEKVLPEYLEKLKAAGLDKVLAEKQTQIDAWLATQK